MSESKSSVKLQRLLLMSDSDMAAAAQQLMQLSDEDNNSSSSNSTVNNNKKKEIKAEMNSKRFFKQSQDEITSAKIEEIFGKEEEILRPIKKRRFRFLGSIYKETKPIKMFEHKVHRVWQWLPCIAQSPAIPVVGLIIILCGIL